ncbi:enterochelin esterase-like enzyme [Corchorus olitorius]|uniref:Enterochelin esterase-like enzyme n=1 Tax=Corchorus olitorius TaxID=93759 RepID=A0A1R3JYP9_9ROSI|nr:enterochelin esterase-like enzyme [Corchorus olitorius]
MGQSAWPNVQARRAGQRTAQARQARRAGLLRGLLKVGPKV